MAITLVCKGIVDSGSEFYYMGPLDECEGCKLNGVCNNLDTGARYKIVDVRKQEHDCPGMDEEGKVVAVEVEKVSSPAILPKKGLLEGVTITFTESKCDNIGCVNWLLCHPIGKTDGSKCTVVHMGKNVDCPRDEKLAFVDIL